MTGSPRGRPAAGGDGDVGQPNMRELRYESFVVRMLIRSNGDVVSGQMTHVAQGRRLYFTAPEEVPHLIRRQLDTINHSHTSRGQSGSDQS
ncbi:MAG: hypothetical protein JOZ81_18145 [Chloroflexi bacterium]|nr:hypothetical protein [Chloroflexota bacterium]MBV9546921.1 hypothetical protein [Chloroflexota bacterium]